MLLWSNKSIPLWLPQVNWRAGSAGALIRCARDLVAKAEGLLNRPEGQAWGGRKMQETLRQLREQWKQTDKGGAPNHALWKNLTKPANAAHKVVEAWLTRSVAKPLSTRPSVWR